MAQLRVLVAVISIIDLVVVPWYLLQNLLFSGPTSADGPSPVQLDALTTLWVMVWITGTVALIDWAIILWMRRHGERYTAGVVLSALCTLWFVVAIVSLRSSTVFQLYG